MFLADLKISTTLLFSWRSWLTQNKRIWSHILSCVLLVCRLLFFIVLDVLAHQMNCTFVLKKVTTSLRIWRRNAKRYNFLHFPIFVVYPTPPAPNVLMKWRVAKLYMEFCAVKNHYFDSVISNFCCVIPPPSVLVKLRVKNPASVLVKCSDKIN